MRSEGLYVAGSGANQALMISPIPGAEGFASITVHVSDGIVDSSTSFNVRVATDPYPWRNPFLRWDVNNDSIVAPNDVLVIVNYLNAAGSGSLLWRETQAAGAPFYDVHADNILAPNGALEVVNYINSQIAQLHTAASSGEGETADAQAAILLMLSETPSPSPGAKPKSGTIFRP